MYERLTHYTLQLGEYNIKLNISYPQSHFNLRFVYSARTSAVSWPICLQCETPQEVLTPR
jgi:hypothetical protein